MRDIMPTKGLKSVKKRKETYHNISESLKNNKLLSESCKENELEEIEMDKIINHSKARTLKEKDKCKKVKNKNKAEKIKKEMLCEAIAYLAFESVLLDEDYKYANKSRIINSYKENLSTLMDEGCLNKKGCPLYEDYISPVVNAFNDVDTAIEEPDKVLLTIQKTEKQLVTESYFDLSENISNKVATVVKEEKEISKNRNLLKETFHKKYDGTSLFNSINIYNFLKEEKEISNDKDINLKENKALLEEISRNAFAETIIDYTFLETLNTCKLLKNDDNMIANKIKNQISKLR